ncbi:hypothetical protein [Embleya scabrispora]|nr:hypothetical protein [Embleya scabrispora]MYS87548.1 hypothetical protein [Streptomyces sp. SID5474]
MVDPSAANSYNRYPAAKRIEVHPFNGHEGGGAFQDGVRLTHPHAAFNT